MWWLKLNGDNLEGLFYVGSEKGQIDKLFLSQKETINAVLNNTL